MTPEIITSRNPSESAVVLQIEQLHKGILDESLPVEQRRLMYAAAQALNWIQDQGGFAEPFKVISDNKIWPDNV